VLQQWHAQEKETPEKIHSNFQLAFEHFQKAWNSCYKNDVALKNIIVESHTQCLSQYGYFFYKAEDYMQAEKFYLHAMKLTPDHLVSINQMGMIRSKQNRFEEAITYFSSILEKTDDPQEHADAFLNLAYVLRSLGKLSEAKTNLENAKKIAPNDKYIMDEEIELNAALDNAALIAAPQALFNGTASITQKTTLQENSMTAGTTKRAEFSA
jgi:tetratricopeptide (TPR) repeat protein